MIAERTGDPVIPMPAEIVMPLATTPEVTAEIVSCKAVEKYPIRVAVPAAKTCVPGATLVPVRNIPGARVPVTAVITSVLGDAAGMVPVPTDSVPTAMVAPMSWTPAVLTPGGQK